MHKEFNAIVFGSTGAVGGKVVKNLAKNKNCKKIFAFTRRPLDENFTKEFPKVITVTWKDFSEHLSFYGKEESPKKETIEQLKYLKANVCFSCFGTTRGNSKDKKGYEEFVRNYSAAIGKICKEGDVPYHYFVSSTGATSKSKLTYTRLKGEAEDALKEMKFKGLGIAQPPLILRDEPRIEEYLSSYITSLLSKFGFHYDVKDDVIAKGMINHFENNFSNDKDFCESFDAKKLKELACEI